MHKKLRIGKYIYKEKVGHVNIYAIDVSEGNYICKRKVD